MLKPTDILKKELKEEISTLESDYKVILHDGIKEKVLLQIKYAQSRLARIN